MTSKQDAISASEHALGWRLKVGGTLFVLALVPWALLLPLPLYAASFATVGTLVAVGVVLKKVIFLSAVAVLGERGFEIVCRKLLRKITPPAQVGPLRHRIGVVMFCLPFVQGVFQTYASYVAPHLLFQRLWVDLGADIMLVASVFVLGGNFWEKLRALFSREARVVYPQESQAPAVRPVPK